MDLVPIKNPRKANIERGGFQASALYRWLVAGKAPSKIPGGLVLLWPGEMERGRRLTQGQFEHRGEMFALSIATALPEQASEKWKRWFHGFSWVSDLSALASVEASDDARDFAHARLSEWIEANHHWDRISWAPDVAAERITHWLGNWEFLSGGEHGREFSRRASKSLVRDARHISRSLPPESAGFKRLHAIKGLVIAAHALFGKARIKAQTLRSFEAEIQAQVLPDGGHVERNPEIQAAVLSDLIEVKNMLAAFGEDVPGWLQSAIDRTAPMLRMLRHPDGGAALFNGAGVGDSGKFDQLLLFSGSAAAPPTGAPYAGFQRLSAGTTHIIMDTGNPGGPGSRHHAGTLSFEMSSHNQRMIVNCGDRGTTEEPWRSALAATAAHSTLVVNDTSSSGFIDGGGMRRGPFNVKCVRNQSDTDGILVEANHDGYANVFGLTHHRALFLSVDGESLRGEDRLVGTGGEQFTIRFHLHPRAHASLLSGGQGVLIKLGKKELWRFQVSSGEVTLEESIYAATLGLPKHSEQIVVSGPLSGNGALIKWAFLLEKA
ncbi:MAG: heparinase II/III family protein [Rhodospirillaceae bacterium]|nr:heparinase II/III family protein [Rhodospirillaceae bacterium]